MVVLGDRFDLSIYLTCGEHIQNLFPMRYLLSILILLYQFNVNGQNLVPNPSFEQNSSCPTNFGQVQLRCTSWRDYCQSPDYFHTCYAGTGNIADVPVNSRGMQSALSGSAYIGISCYRYPEYAGVPLIAPLQIGLTYKVSMFVSTAEAFKYATSGLGVYFYDSGLHQVTAPTFNMLPLNVAPQISYINYGLVFDTANWVYLTGNFIADSAYDNMVIGLFQDTAQMIKYQFNPTGGNYSYYFIDSVEVKLANYLALMFSDTTVCKGDSVSVPFVAGNNHFNSNNVFTLQLSNASGSFANPVNLASVS